MSGFAILMMLIVVVALFIIHFTSRENDRREAERFKRVQAEFDQIERNQREARERYAREQADLVARATSNNYR
jgi:uncharacterized membrane protein